MAGLPKLPKPKGGKTVKMPKGMPMMIAKKMAKGK